MPKVNCKICDSEFYVKPSHFKKGWGKYCSVNCRHKSQFKGNMVKCSHCDKETYKSLASQKRSKSGKFFCNKKCQTIWRNKVLYTGENHSNWKSGIRTYRNILKRSKTKEECNICKTDDKRILVVHHIDKNRNNNKLENLVCLCHNCHYLVHHHNEEINKIMVPIV